MSVLRCHQDFQDCSHQDYEFLRNYLTKYVAKFSDSCITDVLNEDAGAMNVATSLLMRYHPLEPEMALFLCGRRARQWRLSTQSGGKRDVITPCPDDRAPSFVTQYLDSSWARGHICLTDFLRKTNSRGDILGWLTKKYTTSGSDGGLESFARNYVVHGEKVVSASMNSWYND